jgi:hypothetical protein
MSLLNKSIPDDAIGKQQGDPGMACVVFGLRKCCSMMATVVIVRCWSVSVRLNRGDTGQKQLQLVSAYSSIQPAP